MEHPISRQTRFSAAFLYVLVCGPSMGFTGNDSALTNLTAIAVPSANGDVPAFVQVIEIPGFLGRASSTAYLHTAYFPNSGNGWSGMGLGWTKNPGHDNLALVDGSVVGMYAMLNGSPEDLRVTVSTKKYLTGLTNSSNVMQAEFADFTNSTRRFLYGDQFGVRLEKLLGSAAYRDHYPTNMFFEPTFKNVTRPSKFKGLRVEGTNAVVSLEIGTNMLARIAFDKNIRPVWATTNGVSIGPIPTNCVFYSEVISNKVVTRVVY